MVLNSCCLGKSHRLYASLSNTTYNALFELCTLICWSLHHNLVLVATPTILHLWMLFLGTLGYICSNTGVMPSQLSKCFKFMFIHNSMSRSNLCNLTLEVNFLGFPPSSWMSKESYTGLHVLILHIIMELWRESIGILWKWDWHFLHMPQCQWLIGIIASLLQCT